MDGAAGGADEDSDRAPVGNSASADLSGDDLETHRGSKRQRTN